jgi:hypothetical protein
MIILFYVICTFCNLENINNYIGRESEPNVFLKRRKDYELEKQRTKIRTLQNPKQIV